MFKEIWSFRSLFYFVEISVFKMIINPIGSNLSQTWLLAETCLIPRDLKCTSLFLSWCNNKQRKRKTQLLRLWIEIFLHETLKISSCTNKFISSVFQSKNKFKFQPMKHSWGFFITDGQTDKHSKPVRGPDPF